VDKRQVCLIDVYETLLTVDFVSAFDELAAMARVPADAFRTAAAGVEPSVTIGDMTMADAMGIVLRSCDVEPEPSLVRALVNADRHLLCESAQLHEDSIAFLEMLKGRGVRSALVSNCAENTRPLLTNLGLDAHVDSIVLSCEVGCAKPSAQIYRHALDELGAEPHQAVLVDDQAAYCEGAAALGIAGIRIVRNGTIGSPEPSGPWVVQSLLELEHIF
jgi:HAD superfamily hydrolase (TIGR01509 family)